MAFSVTPSSGGAPYTFTAEFSDVIGFQSGDYTLSFYNQTAAGACPVVPLSGTSLDGIAQALINDGVFTTGTSNSVPVGSCRTYNLVINRVSDGSVIDQSSDTVDNIGEE